MNQISEMVLLGLALLLFLLFAFRSTIKSALGGVNESPASANENLAEIIAREKQRMRDEGKEGQRAGEDPPDAR